MAVFFVLGCNVAFWTATVHEVGGLLARPSLFVALLTILLCAFTTMAALLKVRGLFKPAVAVLFAVSVIVDHFALFDGIRLDAALVQSVVEAESREVRDLITPTLLLHVALLGVIPLGLLLGSKIRFGTFLAELKTTIVLVLATVAVLAAVGFGFNKELAGFGREHREVLALVTPFNYVRAVRKYLSRSSPRDDLLVSVGADARSARHGLPGHPRRVVVLVVGETARAANFSLNGYDRPTDPELADRSVVSFTNVHSCGTSTASALPCMFSDRGRARFDAESERHRENLLDVLRHAGVDVLWRDNNTGCKHVCDRVRTENLNEAGDPELCDGETCFDEILLDGLVEIVDRADKDMLIVLHQQGSHGPAYFLRYPPAFRKFSPECANKDLTRCSRESIVNAYDNSILYTDHVLARLVEILGRSGSAGESALVYVSDHGESLGEQRLYLHGMPFAFAPDAQIHVPMIVWFSPALIASDGIDLERLSAARDAPVSHDNLFHTVLGLFEVHTRAYVGDLDVFAPFRTDPRRRAAEREGRP